MDRVESVAGALCQHFSGVQYDLLDGPFQRDWKAAALAAIAACDVEDMLKTIREQAQEIEALREREEARAWQGIETVPKDGTEVLARCSNGEHFSAVWAKCSTGYGMHVCSDIGWVNATHWQPLPAPPQSPGGRVMRNLQKHPVTKV